MNTGASWPDLEEAESRVLRMQSKLHQWVKDDPDRRFDDLANLVYEFAGAYARASKKDKGACWTRCAR